MEEELKDKLRLLKLDVLYFLHTLATTKSLAVDLKGISGSTGTAESDLRGVISTLRRMKYKETSLIRPAGRDDRGRLRWQINTSVVDKEKLGIFLEEEVLGKQM